MINIDEKLKSLDVDNNIFFTLIIVSLWNINVNEKLRKHFLYNEYSKEELRKEYIFGSSIILYLFLINLKRNIDGYENTNISNKEKELLKMRISASYLFIIAQLIGIYYLFYTDELSDEII